MTKLTILRGLSGSGKSTWAEAQPGAVIVSRDRLRVAMFGSDGVDYYQRHDLRACEDAITAVEHAAIDAALRAGKDVISDNTNIEVKYMKPIAKIGYERGAQVQTRVFDVPVETAIERNKKRAEIGGRDVPETTIRKQHERFKQSKKHTLPEPVQPPAKYLGTPGKPKAFLVDIDGTLAHMRDYRGPFEWHNVHLDDVDDVVAEVVGALWASNEYRVIVMSGRDSSCMGKTVDWLNMHAIPFDELFMRPEKDMRPDNEIKAELFDTHIRDNFDVQFVIDDRWQVCKMWLGMGLKVFNVSGLDRGEF